jgi:YVTN family beta-propeller protein
MRGWERPLLGALLCLVFPLRIASAQDSAALLFQDGAARDVAVSPAGDVLYVALYSSDDVVALDAATGTEKNRVRVGDGPSALVAAGDTITVLNRAGASVSILNSTDLSVRATVPVPEGTNAIAGMGNGRIAAIDPYGTHMVIIDVASGSTAASVQLSGMMPVGVAFANGSLLVASRTPSVLVKLDPSTLVETGRVSLTGAPRAIAACGPGRVVIAVDSALVLVDVSTLQILQTAPISVTAIVAATDGVVCIVNGEARGFDANLVPVFTSPAPPGARGARMVRNDVVAWSPELGRVWRMAAGPAGAPLPIAQSPPPPGPAEPAAVAAVATPDPETTPPEPVVTEPTLAPIPAADAVEQPTTSQPTATARPASESATESDITTSAVDEEPAASVVTTEAEVLYHLTIRPNRSGLGGNRPYAPRFGDPTGRSFREELERALAVATDSSSLTQIDFNNPAKNLQGDIRSTGSGKDRRIQVGPGVAFDIDEVHVKADSLTSIASPQQLVLDGNVELNRGTSSLTADRIRAFSIQPLPFPEGRPLVPSNREKVVPHPLVPHGYKSPDPDSGPPLGIVEMDQLDWVEPDRRLQADQLRANTLGRNADLVNPHGQTGPLYFGAERLQVLGPENITGTDFWVTTCDEPVPHYRLRLARVVSKERDSIEGSHARLQLGQTNTPFYVPRMSASLLPGDRRLRTELNLGRASDIGNFVNVAQWVRLSDNVEVAPRLYVTTQQGTGFGIDSEYNFMEDPSSALFRSQGKLQTLYTTEDSGYTHWYHRQEFTPNTVLLGQWEQWYDQGFYKDFYNDEYENRTGPRTFASVTHSQSEWLATGTVAKATHDFTTETEKLPELAFHLFERRIAGNLYGTFDTIGGFYETQPETLGSMREVTVGRLSYDWNVARGFNLLPFVEMDATYYSKTLDDEQDAIRGSATIGVTAQARLQRSFAGLGHFTGFKHLIIPSATLSFRPDTTLDAEDTPRFDDYDDRPGRFRIESTIDNILLGRNGPTGEIWPVARLTLYQGNDIENEAVRSNDYEVELEVRPRPAWGLQAVGEMHDLNEDDDLPGADFNRLLTYLFYDDKLSKNSVNGRLGFAYTESSNDVLNQEILYGIGYRLTGKWSVAFEQRFDFERDELTRQTYSVRRKFHDWEVGLMFRDKDSGVDIGIEINLVSFPEIGIGL